jgi:two-component system, response regulator FlrC
VRRIRTLAEVERKHILNTLAICGNNRTHAAKVLGLSIRGLRYKLHQYAKQGFAAATLQPRLSGRSESF